jgi:DNA invertase Pin-like site-specific DNA recombinase
MDRLTRQHPVKVIQLLQDMKDRGVKVISITEPAFNMEHEMSEVMLYLITWFNNYFLKKLKRDIKSGMDRAREKGKTIGRPLAEFNRLRAYQLLFMESKSIRAVAKELGVPVATMYRFKRDATKDPQYFIKKP